MGNRNGVTRREALRMGMGVFAGTIAGRTMGAAAASGERLITPHQTEGPFFPRRRRADEDADLTRIEGRDERARGDVVVVRGAIRDQHGVPVSGALIDVWQANAYGRYDHENDPNPAPLDPNFQGWAKMLSAKDGSYAFTTIVPGAYKIRNRWTRPPHIHFKVARRGYREITTQMYFKGQSLNDTDRILQALPSEEQELLVVDFTPEAADNAVPVGQFDLFIAKV